jgi:hypothetical protein
MYAADHSSIDQGALVASELFHPVYAGSAGIVLTPRCDIEQEKAGFLTLAAVVPALVLLEQWETLPERRNQLSGIMNGRLVRWHWLDPHDAFPDGAAVDFQLVASVEPAALDDAAILTALASPWCEHMTARYAAYASRVGIPDVPKDVTTQLRNEILQAYESRSDGTPGPE